MRTTVIIPSRNEGDVVVSLAAAVRACCDEVIVVDGHSTDGSPERLRAAGVTVIEDRGQGKGDAIRRGLEVAGHALALGVVVDARVMAGQAIVPPGQRMRDGC